MVKYQKRPEIVNATQLTEQACWDYWLNNVPFHHLSISGSYHAERKTIYNASVAVSTKQGLQYANLGDWIITDETGQTYPCPDSIFRALYEAIE